MPVLRNQSRDEFIGAWVLPGPNTAAGAGHLPIRFANVLMVNQEGVRKGADRPIRNNAMGRPPKIRATSQANSLPSANVGG